MAAMKVLSVGQCGLDHGSISGYLRRGFSAAVESADTHDQALAALSGSRFDLVLVNRVCDADGAPGVDLIRAMKSDPATSAVPVMLVSNHSSAQAEAIKLGALPGFGKGEMHSDKAATAIRRAVPPPE
jgi:two-component system, chemotaxis family, chemotaxis protein CheY